MGEIRRHVQGISGRAAPEYLHRRRRNKEDDGIGERRLRTRRAEDHHRPAHSRSQMTCDLKFAERHDVDGVGHRRERLAARLVVFAGQATKSVRIVIETNSNAALAGHNRRLTARAPRSERLIATRHCIKRHETFPRKTPVSYSRWHEAAVHPRLIWSQPVGCTVAVARSHRHSHLQTFLTPGGTHAAFSR